MFRLCLPTIIRELRSLTKVTLVIYIYNGNGMMAACRLMYTMVLDMVLPVFRVSFVSCKTLATNEGHGEDRQHHIQNHRIQYTTCCHHTFHIINIYHKSNFSQTTQLPDDGWKTQPKHVGELCMTF